MAQPILNALRHHFSPSVVEQLSYAHNERLTHVQQAVFRRLFGWGAGIVAVVSLLGTLLKSCGDSGQSQTSRVLLTQPAVTQPAGLPDAKNEDLLNQPPLTAELLESPMNASAP